MIFQQHLDGINRSCLGRRRGIGAATVQRYFLRRLQKRARQDQAPLCPKILGIDEHFFTRRKGYATTFCDLKNHRIYDVTLGRSEAALESYRLRLQGKELVRIVCMDLAAVYRCLVRKHFPKAVIVADRFHVIRLINHHFLACWREIDPVGSKNRGLLSLMRRHRHNLKPEQQLRLMAYLAERPTLDPIYRFKQKLCYLLLKKHKSKRQCQNLIPRFLRAVNELRQSGLAQLVTLETPCIPGPRRSFACGASLAPTQSPKGFTTKWRPSADKPTGSATSKITGSECRCYVLRKVWDWGLPPFLV